MTKIPSELTAHGNNVLNILNFTLDLEEEEEVGALAFHPVLSRVFVFNIRPASTLPIVS